MASPSVLHWHFLGCRVWFWVCFAAVLATSFSAFTRYTLHSTLYTFYSTPYLTLYAGHSALYTLHFTLSHCTLHFTLHTLQSPLHTLRTTFLTQHSISSHSTHASSSGSAGGSPSIILCNILTPFYTCASLDWKGEFWTGGPGGGARAKHDDNNYSHM